MSDDSTRVDIAILPIEYREPALCSFEATGADNATHHRMFALR